LVRRKGRGLELTTEGRELAAVASLALEGLSDCAARFAGGEWTARLAASNTVAQWLLLPRLKTLAREVPKARFEIHHEQNREMVARVREGVYDVAFVRRDEFGPGIASRNLGEFGYSLVWDKSLAKPAPKTPESALGTLPLALPIAGTLREVVERFAARAGVGLRVVAACTSYQQAVRLAASGMCAAVAPDLALAEFPAKAFHRLPFPETYRLALAWSPRNADTRPALAALIDAAASIVRP
jgi:DNA-binding transcriptional LysR family regulator